MTIIILEHTDPHFIIGTSGFRKKLTPCGNTDFGFTFGKIIYQWPEKPDPQDVNGKLDKIRLGIEECYSKILKNEGAVNSTKLKNAFLGMESGEMTFFKFYEQFLSDYEKKVNSGLRVNGTRSKYKTLLRHLRNFVLTKYGYSDVSFNYISVSLSSLTGYKIVFNLSKAFVCFTISILFRFISFH